MSRRFNKVLAATVFVVAFSCFIPLQSGADFNDVKQAHVMITFQIPQDAPRDAPQIPTLPGPDTSTSTPASSEPSPTSDALSPPGPPVVVSPTIPDPVDQPATPVTSDPIPAVPPVINTPVIEVPSAAPVLPDPTAVPAPLDSEGSTNEEVSP